VPAEVDDDDDESGVDDEEEAIEGNQAVLKYIGRSLREMRELYTMIHNRHIVLYTALRNGWTMAKTVDRHLATGDSKTVFEKILKEEEEDRKRKRDDSPDRQAKRKRTGDGGKGDGRAGRGGSRHDTGPTWELVAQMTQAAASAAVTAVQGGSRGRQPYNPSYGRPYAPQYGAGSFAPAYGGYAPTSGGRGGIGPAGPPPRRAAPYPAPDNRECFNCRQTGHGYKYCRNPPARQ
jgi:hypothetical protein